MVPFSRVPRRPGGAIFRRIAHGPVLLFGERGSRCWPRGCGWRGPSRSRVVLTQGASVVSAAAEWRLVAKRRVPSPDGRSVTTGLPPKSRRTRALTGLGGAWQNLRPAGPRRARLNANRTSDGNAVHGKTRRNVTIRGEEYSTTGSTSPFLSGPISLRPFHFAQFRLRSTEPKAIGRSFHRRS
jgi:hypothetical protein